MTLRLSTLFLVAGLLFQAPASTRAAAANIQTLRVPGGGVQPQAAVGEGGVVHLIYLAGDPAKSDVMYVRSSDGGADLVGPASGEQPAGQRGRDGDGPRGAPGLGKGGRVTSPGWARVWPSPRRLGKSRRCCMPGWRTTASASSRSGT